MLVEDLRDIEKSVSNTKQSGQTQSGPSYQYHRLYRILFREDMFHLAYQRICAKAWNMTLGSDGKTIDGTSLQRIKNLIQALRNETYQPTPHEGYTFQKPTGRRVC